MIYKSYYQSPIGKLLLASKENKLMGLWIEGQKYYLGNLKEELQENNTEEILVKTKKWLDRYFDAEKPEISELELAPIGSEFRKNVWKLLCKIPYGEITTYKSIAENVAKLMNRKQMSAQAIGGAVGHNPISIIIPCHRVIGTDGSLTGYAGGIDKKIKLLKLEKVDLKDIKV
ncbi:MAG: methylated-DNA--[protein]-cysteine S-methyltransferase [Clostridia bacterium]|jgi:methylated-DNA-[protein]-cysteine S-methyltransferase|nr:methylated-DNA--[protein]-cysteine S-methyltransferase [Clostridia bacterium]